MTDVSNKTIVALLSIALVITLVGTIVSVGKLNSLTGNQGVLTGAVTQSGTASLTVQGTADIIMRDNNVSFIPGYYNASCGTDFAWLDTYNDTHENNLTCWINSSDSVGVVPYWGPRNQSAARLDQHVLENNGSTLVNISTSTGNPNATNFVCRPITGTANNTPQCPFNNSLARVQINASNNETNACFSGLQSTNITLLSSTAETNVTLCSDLDYADTADAMNVYFEVKIPKDAGQGAHVMTITYIATAK